MQNVSFNLMLSNAPVHRASQEVLMLNAYEFLLLVHQTSTVQQENHAQIQCACQFAQPTKSVHLTKNVLTKVACLLVALITTVS